MTKAPRNSGSKVTAAAAWRGERSEGGRSKLQAARLSVASNSLLTLLKFAVGFGTGSIGVLSEALHSAVDLMAAGIAYFSVRVSDSPPDEDHPYGHGKIESISGLIEAVLIFAGAGLILIEAFNKLRSPHADPVKGVGWGLAVMALSALVNLLISSYLHRIAKEQDSPALRADAEHLRADVLSSLGVFLGLLLVSLTGQPRFDPLAAMVITLMILRAAWRLTRDALQPLLDGSLPEAEEAAIRRILDEDERVLGYHKLRTRKSGSQRHADMHVQIEDESTLIEAHDLTEELEDRIRAVLPAIHINIHTEPYREELRHQEQAHGVDHAPDASRSEVESASRGQEQEGLDRPQGHSDVSPSREQKGVR